MLIPDKKKHKKRRNFSINALENIRFNPASRFLNKKLLVTV